MSWITSSEREFFHWIEALKSQPGPARRETGGSVKPQSLVRTGLVLDLTPRTRRNKRMLCRLRFVVALSRSSERILILVFLWYKATNFRGIRGDCRLAAPADFIRGISAGKLDSSRLE